MELNESGIKGKWLEIKGEVRKAWGKLTDDELEATKGDATAIGGLILQKYGKTQEDYAGKLSDILRRYEEKKDAAVEQVKSVLKK
ncbi:MAG: CsbD family protein [Bdellovibrionales bacterium]|nr:CsbD family protein [Bdellovibrionales bacterium]